MQEIPKIQPVKIIVNQEYEERGSKSYTLELTCLKCSKVYEYTKFSTPPTEGSLEEPKIEVLRNIRQTVLLMHFTDNRCNGPFSDREIS